MEEWVMSPWFNQDVLFQINEPTDHPLSLPEDYFNLIESVNGGVSRNVKGGGKQSVWEGAGWMVYLRWDGGGAWVPHPSQGSSPESAPSNCPTRPNPFWLKCHLNLFSWPCPWWKASGGNAPVATVAVWNTCQNGESELGTLSTTLFWVNGGGATEILKVRDWCHSYPTVIHMCLALRKEYEFCFTAQLAGTSHYFKSN